MVGLLAEFYRKKMKTNLIYENKYNYFVALKIGILKAFETTFSDFWPVCLSALLFVN